LQTGSEVRRLADDRLFLRRAFTNQIADHHEPGGNTNAGLQPNGADIEAADRVDDTQPGANRPLRIVFMRLWVAEIDQHAVAHVFGNKPVERGDSFADRAVIGGDYLAQVFGVEPCREFGRADQIAEHHRQLPALGFGSHRGIGGERWLGSRRRVRQSRRAICAGAR